MFITVACYYYNMERVCECITFIMYNLVLRRHTRCSYMSPRKATDTYRTTCDIRMTGYN